MPHNRHHYFCLCKQMQNVRTCVCAQEMASSNQINIWDQSPNMLWFWAFSTLIFMATHLQKWLFKISCGSLQTHWKGILLKWVKGNFAFTDLSCHYCSFKRQISSHHLCSHNIRLLQNFLLDDCKIPAYIFPHIYFFLLGGVLCNPLLNPPLCNLESLQDPKSHVPDILQQSTRKWLHQLGW